MYSPSKWPQLFQNASFIPNTHQNASVREDCTCSYISDDQKSYTKLANMNKCNKYFVNHWCWHMSCCTYNSRNLLFWNQLQQEGPLSGQSALLLSGSPFYGSAIWLLRFVFNIAVILGFAQFGCTLYYKSQFLEFTWSLLSREKMLALPPFKVTAIKFLYCRMVGCYVQNQSREAKSSLLVWICFFFCYTELCKGLGHIPFKQ